MMTAVSVAMIVTFMFLIMTRRLSAMVALVLVPILFAIGLGGAEQLGEMALDGIKKLAPTGVMLIFAILYFGIMIDTGLFRPLINTVMRVAGRDPRRVTIGTVLLAFVVGLDGDSTTAYMVTIAAMLPVYRSLGMDVRILACLAIMTSAVSNLFPWGGPTARAAAALHLDPSGVFKAILPAMGITLIWVIIVAWHLGRKTNLELRSAAPDFPEPTREEVCNDHIWNWQAWCNLALTVALFVALIFGVLPLSVLFIVAFCIAITINFRTLDAQRQLIASHAGNALAVGGLVFAAGIFTGVLNGTGMAASMAQDLSRAIPPAMSSYSAIIIAALSIPFTYLLSNDAFYFGIFPVLAQTAQGFGLSAQEAAIAALVGQQFHLLSPLVASTYLLVQLVGIDFAEHVRFTAKWAAYSCLVFFFALVATGAMPILI